LSLPVKKVEVSRLTILIFTREARALSHNRKNVG
jgi:hypothetical protein